VIRTLGAAVGVLLAILFLVSVASHLTQPSSASQFAAASAKR
jgi:hypothetical protein